MDRLIRSAVARPLTLTVAVMAGAIALSYLGASTLFLPAPPVMQRNARYLAILLVPGLALVILGAIGAVIRGLPKGWPVAAKRACVALMLAGGAVLPFLSSVAYFLLHFACYGVSLCAFNSLPRETMYTITVATRDTPFASLLVLGAVAGLALASRRGRRHMATP
jgi:hypothetical protein